MRKSSSKQNLIAVENKKHNYSFKPQINKNSALIHREKLKKVEETQKDNKEN